jgi:hypothetical protein
MQFPAMPARGARGLAGLLEDKSRLDEVEVSGGKETIMKETASERLVRQIARELALEALQRIRARLREVEAAPLARRLYETEWEGNGPAWPTTPRPAKAWVPYLMDDLELARAEVARCRY